MVDFGFLPKILAFSASISSIGLDFVDCLDLLWAGFNAFAEKLPGSNRLHVDNILKQRGDGEVDFAVATSGLEMPRLRRMMLP
jgi:hypothetical protein